MRTFIGGIMINSVIYQGKVRHRRFTIKPHEFAYSLFMFCFNVDSFDMEFKNVPQVSNGKFNWFSFRRKDYLKNAMSLDQAARTLVKDQKGIYPLGKIYLLTHLRCFGYCFNPISLYFVFKPNSEELDFMIVEVTNTPWGEKHVYVLGNPERIRSDIYKYTASKKLHVSPFLEMDYEYHFKVKIKHDSIIVHIENYKQKELHFDATLALSAVPLPATNTFLRFPFITYKVTAAIYWQALKLWLKGIPFHCHPRKNKD
jgi:DUF1365 family protein